MTEVRRIMSVADIVIPPTSGQESEVKWRGVLYEDDTYEFFMGNEYFDWDPVQVLPEPVLMALEYILSWRALDCPEEFESPPG